MKAVIMAGGEGTRLRPLTSTQPKPMLPLANRPMMEHIVRLLKEHGFDEIVVTLAFLPQAIRTYFGDGSEFGVRMVYATEETPLGTAGSVLNARQELTERFLVISGAVLTDFDLSEIVRFHDENTAMVTIAVPVCRLSEGVWLGEGAEIDPDAKIDGPAVIGDYCKVEAGAQLHEYCVLGSNVVVRDETFIERSVVHDNAYLGNGVRLRG